jgi:hypothetical protein
VLQVSAGVASAASVASVEGGVNGVITCGCHPRYAHTRTPASDACIAAVAGGAVAAGDVSAEPSALLRRVTHTHTRERRV